MNLKLLYTLFLLSYLCSFSQLKRSELYNNLSYYKTQDNNLLPEDVFKKLKTGEFKKEKDFKIYKKLGNNTWWFHLPITKSNDNYLYLTHSYPYLAYGKVFHKNSTGIDSLHRVSYIKNFPFKYVFYRHPTWKIPAKENCDILLKLKNGGSRTRLEFHLETENEYLKRVQNEYLVFGFFIAILTSLIIILLYFSILKKEYSVIFYVVYIFLMLIEFLAGKGLGIQYLWHDSNFLTTSIRSFSQTLGVFFMGLFYLNFYKLKSNDNKYKLPFKIGILATIPLILIYVYKAFFGGLGNYYLYVWIILKLIAIAWLINHLILAKNKKIPHYLMIAFILPIISIVISQNINPSANSYNFWFYGGINFYYVALIAEILIFTRFIFSSVIEDQKKYVELKKASDELQYNFQNKALEIQQNERNKLLSNVHDSFGGYLEALKLRLLQKSENTPEKIQEILDGFYKEYRYLLNDLYSPKINSENFIENLIEFCGKINQLSNNIIKHNFSIKDTQLTQEKCVHLYRIVSELTTNAIKYSEASEININLSQDNENNIILSVKDNGIGFDKTQIKNNSYGLNNIKDRAKQINATVDISSEINHGTNVTVYIPKDE